MFEASTTLILKAKLNEVKQWLIGLHIDISNSLFESVLSYIDIDVLAKSNDKNSKQKIKDYGLEYRINAIRDAYSFIDIYNGLSKLKSSIPIKSIKEILQAPVLLTAEISSSGNVNSRNKLFEIELASLFISKGFNIINFDDVQFEFNNRRYIIECKRLHSLRNVKYNIDYAYQQLSKKINRDNEYGIIALSIDKLFDIDAKLYQSVSVDSISRKAEQESNVFINKYKSIWNSFQNIHIVGIIVCFRFIADLNSNVTVSTLYSVTSPLGVEEVQNSVFNDLLNIASKLNG